jgi:GT2 family glycosyltransferase
MLLSGFCLLLKDTAIQSVGMPDNKNFPMSGEDFDYCFRLKNKGFVVYIDNSTFVYHYGHVTAKKQNTFNADREWSKGAKRIKEIYQKDKK